MKERQVRLGCGEALEGDIWTPDPSPLHGPLLLSSSSSPPLHATKGSNDTGRMKVP